MQDPKCTVQFYSNKESDKITRVYFSDDGTQVISASHRASPSMTCGGTDMSSMRVFDIASGTQVCQLAGEAIAIAEGPCGEHTTGRHVLTAHGDMLLVYECAKEQQLDERAAVPVAFFKAPQHITSVQCHGTTICVGGELGAVCILTAPFLTA